MQLHGHETVFNQKHKTLCILPILQCFSGLKIIINKKKMGLRCQVFVNNKLSSQGD